MKAVILCGGVGSRLWPMSRLSKPKQFFEVIDNEPLVVDTYRRLLRLLPAEQIYFSVSPAFAEGLRQLFPEAEARILIEPEKRDTGPAMGYVAMKLSATSPDEPLVFVPSDHYIRDEDRFLSCLTLGEKLVRETGKLVDIGITPTFPSTALGYTKVGKCIRTENGLDVYEFEAHTEKPPYAVAKEYLEGGSYLWHANYYMWTPAKFLVAFDQYAPEVGRVLRQIQSALPDDGTVHELYSALPKKSFDYSVTEHLGHGDILVIRGDFGWSDVGAWDTLHERLAEEPSGNVTRGRCVTVDTSGSLVYGTEKKLTVVVGMEEAVVVDTPDALLVCKKDQSQRVKEIVERLSTEGHGMYL